MEKLKNLQDIRTETLTMEFNYKNVQRLMFLVYECRTLLESSSIIPNKEIALHQTNSLIENEVNSLICTEDEVNIKAAFGNLLSNFKLVLSYFA